MASLEQPAIVDLKLPNENRPIEGEERDMGLKEKRRIFLERNRVNILVTGEVGSGKSSLINAMLGSVYAHPGHGPQINQTYTEPHYGKYLDTDVTICETMGFVNPNMEDKKVLKNISRSVPAEYDVFLLCHRMECRSDDRVKQMLQCIGKYANPALWERAIIVLTCANFFLSQQGIYEMRDEAKKELMMRHRDETKKSFKEFSKNVIKPEVFDDIPFVFAGVEREFRLPITQNWIQELWEVSMSRCSVSPVQILRPSKILTLFKRKQRTQRDVSLCVSADLQNEKDIPTESNPSCNNSIPIHEEHTQTVNTAVASNSTTEYIANGQCTVEAINESSLPSLDKLDLDDFAYGLHSEFAKRFK